MAQETVIIKNPAATSEGVTVQKDGRVYLTQSLAEQQVNIFAEVVEDDSE